MGNFKQTFKLYLKLIRFDKPIGTLLLLYPTLCALWLASNDLGLHQAMPNIKLLIVFTLGTFFMRSAGCAVNDVADRKFDAHVQRTAQRVVATGQVSVREALIVAGVCALIAGILALYLNALALWLCLPAACVACGYPFFKRFFAVPQAVLGVAFSFGIPIAYAAVQNTLPLSMWLLFAANFFWVMAYDTAYAMADKPDDMKLGLKTSAIFFGKYDKLAIDVLCAIFLILYGLVLFMEVKTIGWAGWLGYSAGIVYSMVLSRRMTLNTNNKNDLDHYRAVCFKVFLSHSHIGLVLWLGLVIDAALR